MIFAKKDDNLNAEIDRLEVELSMTDAGSEEYAVIARNLETLYKIKANKNSSTQVSADTIASIVGTLASIFAVMHYEETRVIASKAWGLIQKIKR